MIQNYVQTPTVKNILLVSCFLYKERKLMIQVFVKFCDDSSYTRYCAVKQIYKYEKYNLGLGKDLEIILDFFKQQHRILKRKTRKVCKHYDKC